MEKINHGLLGYITMFCWIASAELEKYEYQIFDIFGDRVLDLPQVTFS